MCVILKIRPNYACRHLKHLCKLGLRPGFGLRTKSDLFFSSHSLDIIEQVSISRDSVEMNQVSSRTTVTAQPHIKPRTVYDHRATTTSPHQSFVGDVNGDGLHADGVVMSVTGGLWRAAAAAATTQHLAVEHAAESDAKLLAEPAVYHEIYCRLECQKQHGQELEQQQRDGRWAETTNADDRHIHHVRSLST